MASITISNLADDLARRLRLRAAGHGRSMEEEAREILRQVVGEAASPRNLAAAIRARVAPFGGAGSTCRRVSRCANRPALSRMTMIDIWIAYANPSSYWWRSMARTVSIFRNNRNLAIRLPRDFEFPGLKELTSSGRAIRSSCVPSSGFALPRRRAAQRRGVPARAA